MALPMGKEDALRIHKILENIGVGSGNPLRAEDVTKIKNNALQALDNLSKGTVAARSGMRTFNDCILISDLGKRRSTGEPILDLDELEELIKENADDVIFGQDGIIIQEIKDSMLNNASKIECTGIKVLGIVHLRWKNSAYDVSINGKKYFRFMFGLNDSVAIKCLNCVESCTNEAESYIVDENAILLEENKFIRIRDVNAENLGLAQEDFALIEKKGIFKKHLQKVGGSAECQMMGCKDKLCCASQIFVDGEKRYCKTCRYPEIVYFDPLASTEEEGQLSLTKRLNFYIDEMAMRPIDKNAKPCADCKRLIRKGVRCSLCSINENTLDEEEKRQAEALYREYADMLPVSLRTFSMFSKKYCFEDVGTILFIIGTDRYYFHKTSIHDKGYLLPVTKVNSYTKK